MVRWKKPCHGTKRKVGMKMPYVVPFVVEIVRKALHRTKKVRHSRPAAYASIQESLMNSVSKSRGRRHRSQAENANVENNRRRMPFLWITAENVDSCSSRKFKRRRIPERKGKDKGEMKKEETEKESAIKPGKSAPGNRTECARTRCVDVWIKKNAAIPERIVEYESMESDRKRKLKIKRKR